MVQFLMIMSEKTEKYVNAASHVIFPKRFHHVAFFLLYRCDHLGAGCTMSKNFKRTKTILHGAAVLVTAASMNRKTIRDQSVCQ